MSLMASKAFGMGQKQTAPSAHVRPSVGLTGTPISRLLNTQHTNKPHRGGCVSSPEARAAGKRPLSRSLAAERLTFSGGDAASALIVLLTRAAPRATPEALLRSSFVPEATFGPKRPESLGGRG